MNEVKLCRDCIHSMPEPGSEWLLRCMNPEVNRKDPYALAGGKPNGSCAFTERQKRSDVLYRAVACGIEGKLFESKINDRKAE